jgi:hypothetical protein
VKNLPVIPCQKWRFSNAIEHYLELASEGLQEPLRANAQDNFVSVVLFGSAIADLTDLDVGQERAIEESL